MPAETGPGFMEKTKFRRYRDRQEAVYPLGENPPLKLSITAMIRDLSRSQKPPISRPYQYFLA
jgi:hypothetical protein